MSRERPFRTVGVVGAGTMGSGIAIVVARAGIRTLLFDVDAATLDAARARARSFMERSVALGKMTDAAFTKAMDCLVPCNRIEDLATCDLVIEAVFEHRDSKISLLRQLHGICAAQTVFATNTSTLSVTELAGACGRPERVVGLHFCLPAERMKLVEVTPALTTSEETLQAAMRFCEYLGQKPIHTQDRPGFILNALAIPLHNSAIRLVESGVARPASIDTAIKTAFGHAMGPFELLDLVGLDTQVRLSDALHSSTNDPRAFCPPLLKRMVAAGWLGAKHGGGFHAHFPEERPEAAFDPADIGHVLILEKLGQEELGTHVQALEAARARGVPVIGFAPYDAGDGQARVVELVVPEDASAQAIGAALGFAKAEGLTPVACRDRPGRILDRLIRPYLNDALRCVDDGLADGADIDFAVRSGLGYREGPIGLAERIGLVRHAEISRGLFEKLGEAAFVPGRRSVMPRSSSLPGRS